MKLYKTWLLILIITISIAQHKKYFQQEVNYLIDVKLDDKNHTLIGKIKIEYKNNSPDTLREIYMHLWPNAYKNNKTQFAKQQIENGDLDFYFAKKSERGYIDSLDFQINGKQVEWNLTKDIDIAIIKLPQPLRPKEKIIIETPFFVKIPYTFSRLGHVGNSYQITQWYPKPAVYDKYGWHPYPYLDQGEFYSEFGRFTVNIHVPANYVVLATGKLVTESEQKWLQKRQELSKKFLKLPSDSVQFPQEFPENQYKTLTFKQSNVHDFAWFAAKDYYYLEDTMKLKSGRIIKVKTAFFENRKNIWKNAIEYTKYAIKFYSEEVGEYPYDVVSVVQGPLGAGAGMEYPTITILDAGHPIALKTVIVHEVGHNWFYGILGNDERRYPWMDEGINSFYEKKAMNLYKYRAHPVGTQMDFSSAYIHWQNTEQPIQEWAHKYSSINYALIVYGRTPKYLKYLEDYIGKETFSKAMKAYYQQWKFKHPYPEDIQKIFEEVSGENLDWFFKDLFSSTTTPDFGLKYKNNKIYAYNLSKYEHDKNLKSYVYFIDKNHKVLGKQKLSNLSYDNPIEITNIPDSTYRVSINPELRIYEENLNNNDVFIRKNFKTWRNPALGFIYTYEATFKRPLNIALPVIGYNYRDGLLLGTFVHYQIFPKHNFELNATPMFGFTSKKLLGMWSSTYRIWLEKTFRLIQIKNSFGYFADFAHNTIKIEGLFKNKDPRQKQLNKITLKLHNIHYTDNNLNLYEETPKNFYKPAYISLSWNYDNWNVLLPLGFNMGIGTNINGVIHTEFSGYLKYRLLKPIYAYISGYVGNNITIGNTSIPNYLRMNLSGYDAFGEHILFDRYRQSDKMISKQLVPNQGNFRALVNKSSKTFLTSLNTGFIFRDLIDIRYDVGLYKDNIYDQMNMEYAVSIGVTSGDIVGIYVPVLSSLYANNFPKDFNELSSNITFFISYSLDKIIKLVSI